MLENESEKRVPEDMYQKQGRKRGRAAKVVYLYLIWYANI